MEEKPEMPDFRCNEIAECRNFLYDFIVSDLKYVSCRVSNFTYNMDYRVSNFAYQAVMHDFLYI